MPRKSSADLHVVRLPGRGRPEPPAKLAAAEQTAWRSIVDAMPDGWADGAAQLVLRRIVAQIAVAERHEERLRRIAESGADLEVELAIAKAHRDTTKSIAAAMGVLRATPRSRMEDRNGARAARDHFARSPRGRRPWDIDAAASNVTERGLRLDEAEDNDAAPA
jgi:hypothetical protein